MKGKGEILMGMTVLLSMFTLTFCSKDNRNNGNHDGKAVLSIRLTDAPADYNAVMINVESIQVNYEGEGWMTLDSVQTGMYNLLDFANGMDTLLVKQEIPAGTISQIRLVLGDHNQIKMNGMMYDLDTPSAQQSGLKFNVNATLAEGVNYKLWIDFDAGRSIVKRGNGTFLLKPVIRVFNEGVSGGIEGTVMPVLSKPYIKAISSANDTFSTYADTISGHFLIQSLDEGTYKLCIEPMAGFVPDTLESVEVTLVNITNVGMVTLEKEGIE